MEQSIQTALIGAVLSVIVTIGGLASPLGKEFIARIAAKNQNAAKKENLNVELEAKDRENDAKRLDGAIIQMQEDIKLLRQQLNDCYSGCQDNILKLTQMFYELQSKEK